MKLTNLIEKVDIIEIKGSSDVEIRGIAYNSKAVRKGYIFVAIEGLKVDGHNYIGDAIARGTEVIFVTQNIEAIENVAIIKVKDIRVALSALSSAFYGKPSEKMELIGVTGRFEAVPTYRNFDIIIDYAHTPDGLENLLDTVREFARGRIILVFGCVGERDSSKRSVMGRIAAYYSDLCVLTTDNCRSEDPKNIIDDIKKGFNKDMPYVEILDRAVAIRYAILNSKEDDTILITGKGHEQRQIIGNQVLYFNEKEIIQQSIRKLP